MKGKRGLSRCIVCIICIVLVGAVFYLRPQSLCKALNLKEMKDYSSVDVTLMRDSGDTLNFTEEPDSEAVKALMEEMNKINCHKRFSFPFERDGINFGREDNLNITFYGEDERRDFIIFSDSSTLYEVIEAWQPYEIGDRDFESLAGVAIKYGTVYRHDEK